MEPSASPKPVTLRSIAERAAVSISAVSLALRNHPSIPAVTRRRIQKIARELGYRPNAMVSALMARIHTRRPLSESPVLGVILSDNDSARFEKIFFYRELMEGARERAFQLGYQLDQFPLKRGRNEARTLYRSLHARNIRGVIIAPLSSGSTCMLSVEGLASCALGYTLHKPELHRVVPNYAQGMALAWAKALARGYRRLGFVSTKVHLSRTHYERYAAFAAQQAMHEDLAALPPLIFPPFLSGNSEEALGMFVEWFRLHRPDVLIFPPGELLKKVGPKIRIPEDVGVILTDVEPGYCLVREDARGIGAGAVDLVVAQIHRNETGIPLKPKLFAVGSDWVDGFSLPARK